MFLMHQYTIIRASRRSISLQISSKNGLVVRAPFSVPEDIIHAFVEGKSEWISKHLTRHQEQVHQEQKNLYYLGQTQSMEYHPAQKTPLVYLEGIFTFSEKTRTQKNEHQILEKWYRIQAREYLAERVAHFAKKHDFSYRDIRITRALTRWGSCSSRDNLNFPWRLMMAPREVIDYVVVHELAHTVHKNHSARFWDLVTTIVPDWKIHREHLQKEGWRYTLPSL